MDLLALVFSILTGIVVYLFQEKRVKQERTLRVSSDLQKALSADKEKLKQAEAARQGAKIGYEKAKEEFLNRYGKYLPADESSSDGSK